MVTFPVRRYGLMGVTKVRVSITFKWEDVDFIGVLSWSLKSD